MLSKKCNVPNSVETGNAFSNNRSAIVTSVTIDIVRAFLRGLSLIKNMGNKTLAIIVDMQLVTNTAFQLFANEIISKTSVDCGESPVSMSPKVIPTVKQRFFTRTNK
ncbi:hypothetical protein KPL35_10110 [Clostridium sp. CF011]|uniref:hypothetical protein n=1 Tax=unclassified Clostridium TaxID=2614128 RepID=UPI001C0DBA38|nr:MULTISPECIES: hypothetical protein [unclassified Clostridium]MBU3092433.1 hypothetical protein [Clostridium sp. CF011]UVE40833.1 hypothetical protein KTC92_17440 [Clostridium sp. CM027]WLC61498.1 hypothetical protein KTC94_15720 [Clostridium sp. CM028]